MNTIITNIKRLCKQQSLSQRQLALRSNVAISTLNDNMNGKSKFSKKTLNKIANSLNTTVIELTKNNELDGYFNNKGVEQMSKLHTLENNFLFFADTNDIIPKSLNIAFPFLISPSLDYQSSDLVLLFNNTNYIIDSFENKSNYIVIGKVVSHIIKF